MDGVIASDEAPVSYAVQREWAVQEFGRGDVLSFRFEVDGDLDPDRLRKAVRRLVLRHEALRTTFLRSRNGLRQKIHPDALPGTWRLITPAEDRPEAFRHALEEATKVSWKLDEGPLFRCALVAGQQTALVLSFHHIISDRWSAGIVKRELSELYDGATIPSDNALQFKNFCEWQNSYLAEAASRDIAYWATEWTRVKGELYLATRASVEAEVSHDLAWTELDVDQKLARDLTTAHRDARVTPFMFFLASLGVFLSRYSYGSPVPIGAYVNNRSRRDHYGVVGCCINTLMLSCDLSEASSFTDLLAVTGTKVFKALRHQQTPFEVIRADLARQG